MAGVTELVFRDAGYVRSVTGVVVRAGADGIVLDRTVFYPTGGGQPGDRGIIRAADGTATLIVDTVKGPGLDEVVHVPAPGAPLPSVGSTVEAVINWDRRHRLMRMHSCLHLLCSLIDAPVTGGQVGEDRGRLDFDLPDVTPDKDDLSRRLNTLIAADHALSARWISDAELAASPELVRTMSVKPPIGSGRVRLMEVAGVDLQPCGGTHVRSTAEIGAVEVVKIEKKGRLNRRVIVAFVEGNAA
ncbi:MAG: alanyl-tRNA editing protein [Alphaproteobacteria bacterium]|nr:alanyl-tRNA editing protein [Alphaproteobacteria bacterium]